MTQWNQYEKKENNMHVICMLHMEKRYELFVCLPTSKIEEDKTLSLEIVSSGGTYEYP